jgi:glycosyltransferase involved in cell wall biosynthesis
MNKLSPQVSVVIATYNDVYRVGLAITSVLEQGLRDLEVIVVNDASTDKTAKVLERYRQRDTRVVLLANSTCLGRAEARNVGIRLAHANLLAILDSDDYMMPSRLDMQAEYMRQNPSIGVLGSWAIYDLDGKFHLAQGPTKDTEIRRRLHRGENGIINASMMVRTPLILSVGGYRSSPYSPTYNEDYYTLVGLLSETKFAVLPEPLIVVDTEGLTVPKKIKAKLVEKTRLVRHLREDNFSAVRLIRNMMGTFLIMALPSKYFGALYYRRLRRLPAYNFPASINAWKQHLEQKRREIEIGS